MSLETRHSSIGRRLGRVLVHALLLALVATGARGERIVAVGDVHGAYDQLVTILRAAGVVDGALTWTGGSATLVQVGDLLDRGPRVRSVLDLLRRLQDEAPGAGGRVVVLFGNHEAMNILAEYRDVDPEAYAEFADAGSEARREAAFEEARQLAAGGSDGAGAIDRDQWMGDHPPGLLEYRAALGPDGSYGRWLRGLPVAVRIGGTIFLHAGLGPQQAGETLAAIDREVHREIATYDHDRKVLVERRIILPFFTRGELVAAVEATLSGNARPSVHDGSGSPATVPRSIVADIQGWNDWLLVAPEGPLWFRGFAHWSEAEGTRQVAALLHGLDADRFVVGHTSPLPTGRIGTRFGGRVVLIDTGMLPGHYPGGRGSALELDGDRVTAIYADRRERLDVPEPAQAPTPAAGPAARPAVLGGRIGRPSLAVAGRLVRLAASTGADPAPAPEGPRWLGVDGRPLPFRTPAQVEAFLRDADVIAHKTLAEGINRTLKLTLEQNGVQAHAVFRTVDVDQQHVRTADGKFHPYFSDRYSNEVAAYHLGRLLGMDNLPPVVPRRLQGQQGSVELWIEHAMTEGDRRAKGVSPPDQLEFTRRLQDMQVFDALIQNIDRNAGNILIDEQWNVWLIDHTRSLSRDPTLSPVNEVTHCSRSLWGALQDLDEEAVRRAVEPELGGMEIRALFKRRRLLVELIRKLIAERGEDQVLFDYGESPVHVSVGKGSASSTRR